MRKIREVLRLRYELKLGYQQIGRSCAIAVSTVSNTRLGTGCSCGAGWRLKLVRRLAPLVTPGA